jgi:hypothetical protein
MIELNVKMFELKAHLIQLHVMILIKDFWKWTTIAWDKEKISKDYLICNIIKRFF